MSSNCNHNDLNRRDDNRTILVTGGAGFIGSAVCRLFIAESCWNIVNIDILNYAATLTSLNDLKESERYRFVRGDIADTALLTELFEQYRFDAVIHLAAESHVDRSITGAAPFVQTNVVGTFALLEAARKYWDMLRGQARDDFRFLHISTDEVYGSLGPEGLFTEASRYDPRSPYAATKASADHLVSAWNATYGLPTLISNCSNNYGPYQFPEKLIPLTILNAMSGRPISIYGDGKQVRDWLFVEDHARALKLILEQGSPGERYNVGGNCERTNLQLVENIRLLVSERLGTATSSSIEFVTDRPGHDRRYAIDAQRIRDKLGWRPTTDVESGLRITIAWYDERRDWWEPLARRYAGERLGLV